MEGIERLIEIMSEMLEEQRGMRTELVGIGKEQAAMRKELAKNNLAIGELRLSVMRLADEIEKIVLLDQRVTKLENEVFRKSA